jgi:hypothetical protein
MPDDLDALTTRLRSDPRDPLTIQALADWLEERGAAPESVRALTVDGPTVLVFGWPEDANPQMIRGIEDVAKVVSTDLATHTGHKVGWVVMPANVTIRAVRGEPRPLPVEPEGCSLA